MSITKIFQTVISVAIIGALVFVFRVPLEQLWNTLENKYLPCQSPIEYSLGSFDERFGLSKEDFLTAINTAEEIWEKPLGRELFSYNSNNSKDSLKINLVYDTRQEATSKLQELDIKVGDDKASYNSLKSRYDALQANYNKQKSALMKQVDEFKKRQVQYEEEIKNWNEKGGAPENDYNRLNEEKKFLDEEYADIQKRQKSLNAQVDSINALVIVLNRLVTSLNIEVKRFNTIGSELGGEFEEGTYQSGPEGEEIFIYQFDNRAKLIRVLAHEFGHALALGHLEDSKAIMYRLNNGINGELTEADLVALKMRCEIK